VATAVDRAPRPGFDLPHAMSEPRHIYASTMHRRGRRWSRRRPLWPLALAALVALLALAVVAGLLLA
jgi:hypothetical protein